MNKIIVGQILKNGIEVGTGVLVSPDIVMTAKHNIIVGDDLVGNQCEEQTVIFRFNKNDEVLGKTINLLKAIDKGIDCVYIRLDETILDKDISVLVDNKNSIKGYSCNVVGFPKLIQGEIKLDGNIIFEGNEIVIGIKKENKLQNYQGLSGAPLIVSGNIVGIIVIQENNEQLRALSIKYIISNLGDIGLKVIKRNITDCPFNWDFSTSILKKAKQIIDMVGPRYSENLNIKTDIYNDVLFILKKDSITEMLSEISNKLKECIKKLMEFDLYNKNEKDLVLKENRNIISEIITQLESDIYVCDINSYKEEQLKKVADNLNKYELNLNSIFETEKNRFEKKYGEGKFENKAWRGFRAAYNCDFPTQYLDNLKDVIKIIQEIRDIFDIDLISKVSKKAVLISGKGGIGKTHLLCDIVNYYFQQNLPAILILGELFKGDITADLVIMNWYQRNIEFEKFFELLNEIGEQNNVYIPVCIDAINEVQNEEYWNINIPLLLAKTERYNNIKIIFSCRSIYLKEYLEYDKINNLIHIEHNGFNQVETKALGNFCEYYGVNINYETISVPEFMNPLFLKMLCEIAKEKDDKMVTVDNIQDLMNDYFSMKNRIISKKYNNYFSIRDNIVPLVLEKITNYMAEKEQYSISWLDLRNCVFNSLSEFKVSEITSGFIKMLLSENLLKESDNLDNNISFAYQKFYEYLYSKKYIDKNVEDIINDVENNKITLGTLEMIQISYFRYNKKELLNSLNGKIHRDAVEAFISGLYWRQQQDMNHNTIEIIETLATSSQEDDVRMVISGLISVSTKINCIINSYYIHKKLKYMNIIKRDCFLSYFLLKEYDNIKVISDMCERAISLKETIFSNEKILLWKIILCWGTSSNDIKLRDKASKGLVNLFRLYPEDMLEIADMFFDIDDDYIQERIWQSIYSAIILLQEKKYAIPVMNYIKEKIIFSGNWPQNVLIRDYLRNIFEYSQYKGWYEEEDIKYVRPPYKSVKHEIDKGFILKYKDIYKNLYWNCQNSDFAIYTIPSSVKDYGITQKDVGLMIFEDILRNGYNYTCMKYDKYIDNNYGSLRSRDEQVERVGKKYQKIYLYREMGNIYDNYEYSPVFQNIDFEIVPSEQGIFFRDIDLTILSENNKFLGTKLDYPFYRYAKWSDKKWFENNDIEYYIPNIITTEFMGKEYYILQGYLSSKEIEKEQFREVWMQLRTYLYSKDKKNELLKWFKDKDFEGRWMPEGGSIYECCLGEYPWSPSMVNYLGQDDQDNEQYFIQNKPAPCYLITTINDYNTEKDSIFFKNERYMVPSKYLFEHMNLVWNGAFGYSVNGKTVIFNGKNNTIFIDKEFLINFLNQNNLEIIWTILGEKQKITGLIGRNFPGRSEFSYTYYMNNNDLLIQNHKLYNIIEPEKY